LLIEQQLHLHKIQVNLYLKKRVLESTEVDFLLHTQDGSRSAVSGGLVLKNLIRSNIVVAMPLNDDDVLTIDLVFRLIRQHSSNINCMTLQIVRLGKFQVRQSDQLHPL
jgi:hypothetical protein